MERVLQALCQGERDFGVDSRALVVATGAATVREEIDGVPVTRAGQLLRVGSVSVSAALIPLLRADDSELLVLHEPNPMALLAYAIARPRHRLIVWYHSQVIRPRWRYIAFYHPFVSFALRRAARVIVSSPALIEHADALAPYRAKTVVVPFGLPELPARPPATDSSRPGFVILFVGRLVPYKGLDVLLQALCGLDGSAIVVGDGLLRESLERQAESLGVADRVSFRGPLSEPTLAELYGTCDVLVLPSKTPAEAFGLVQVEAMARGKPVISTTVASGVPWVNQDGVTGFTVPPDDADALRSALARLQQDAELRARMGEAGRQRFREYFTHAAMVQRTTSLYEEVTAESGSPPAPFIKRAFDVALSAAGLLLSAPVWAVAALLIKLEDGGPVFYRQDRVGAGGRTFSVLKFRSMVPDAERHSGPLQATADDPRVTRVGKLLRATAMDELPQLVNILRGDMSFVGPRALRPEEIDANSAGEAVALEAIDGYHARSIVQPGLTGVAQIYAPRDVARRCKFRYDLVYIRRRSFWLDLRLIMLSFWISFRGTWENRERKF
jgi:rhamnosyl/mannosyltransferase